jgi:hypothetical protein
MKLVTLACALGLASPLTAQTFAVKLGGKVLGELSYEEEGRTATLISTLDSTPMGVFNGTFTGTSTGLTTGQFTGESRSSRKQRVVSVQIEDSIATQVDITPADEITDLSDVARVPPGIMDPVRVIGTIIAANGCPPAMQMYDGRRVTVLQPLSPSASDDTLTCPMQYSVVMGPGHLSPLGISSASMELVYSTVGGSQTLKAIRISSGLFRLGLIRSE